MENFLLPLLADLVPPALQSVAKKVVGDAPPAQAQAQAVARRPGFSRTPGLTQTRSLASQQMTDVQPSSTSHQAIPPTAFSRGAAFYPRFQPDASVSIPHNAQNQTVADAAAVSQFTSDQTLQNGLFESMLTRLKSTPASSLNLSNQLRNPRETEAMSQSGTMASPTGNNREMSVGDLMLANMVQQSMWQLQKAGRPSSRDVDMRELSQPLTDGHAHAPQPVAKVTTNQGTLLAPPVNADHPMQSVNHAYEQPDPAPSVMESMATPAGRELLNSFRGQVRDQDWVTAQDLMDERLAPKQRRMFAVDDMTVATRGPQAPDRVPGAGDSTGANFGGMMAGVADGLQGAVTGLVQSGANALDRLTNKTASAIINASGQFIDKIVGDAVLDQNQVLGAQNRGYTSGSDVKKVVGDAPAVLERQDATMTDEQTSAAVSNVVSGGPGLIMARVVLEEQTMQTAASMISAQGDWLAMTRNLAHSLEQDVSSVEGTSIETVEGIRGMELVGAWSTVFVAANRVDLAMTSATATGLPVTAIRLDPVVAPAPPLMGSTTVESLMPLLMGGSVSDFSTQLRLKSDRVNIENDLAAFASISDLIESQEGYSFAPSLLRALLYIKTHYTIIGEGLETFASGGNAYLRDNFQGDVDFEQMWPFSRPGVDTNALFSHFAVTTEQAYIKKVTGLDDESDNDWFWQASEFDKRVAIVFVRPQDTHNHKMNLANVATHVSYPMSLVHTRFARGYYIDRAGTVRETGNSRMWKKPNCTYIPGPTDVLFVIVGGNPNTTYTVPIGINANNLITVSSTTHPPATPRIVNNNDADFRDMARNLNNRVMMPTWLQWMQKWEGSFGNSSDRAMAMRTAAEHCRLYGSGIHACNNALSGGVMSVTGLTDVVFGEPNTTNAAPMMSPSFYEAQKPVVSFDPTGKLTLMTACAMPTNTYITNGATDYNSSPRFVDDIIPYNTVMSDSHHMLRYLVTKRRLFMREEVPATHLLGLGRIAYTIDLMSNMMASATDALFQVANVPLVRILMGNSIGSNDIDMMLDRVMDGQVRPALMQMFTAGVQFPQAALISQTLNQKHTIDRVTRSARIRAIYPARTYNGSRRQDVIMMSRIPRTMSAAWVSTWAMTEPGIRLNLPQMKPRLQDIVRHTVPTGLVTEVRKMWVVDLAPEVTGATDAADTIIQKLASEVCYTVYARRDTAVSANPGFYLCQTDSNYAVPLWLGMVTAEGNLQLIVNTSLNGNIPTTIFTPKLDLTPKGQYICHRDNANGMAPLRLVATGPFDMYNPRTTMSLSMKKLTKQVNNYAAMTTATFNNVPEGVFSASMVARMRNMV